MSQTNSGKLTIQGLEIYAKHGFYPEERKILQKFIIDVELSLDLKARSDYELSELVDYETLVKLISNEMKKSEELIENLAFRLNDVVINSSRIIKSSSLAIKKSPQIGQNFSHIIFECKKSRL